MESFKFGISALSGYAAIYMMVMLGHALSGR